MQAMIESGIKDFNIMGDSSTKAYAFLSSLYTEHQRLREELFRIGRGRLWMAEYSDKDSVIINLVSVG